MPHFSKAYVKRQALGDIISFYVKIRNVPEGRYRISCRKASVIVGKAQLLFFDRA